MTCCKSLVVISLIAAVASSTTANEAAAQPVSSQNFQNQNLELADTGTYDNFRSRWQEMNYGRPPSTFQDEAYDFEKPSANPPTSMLQTPPEPATDPVPVRVKRPAPRAGSFRQRNDQFRPEENVYASEPMNANTHDRDTFQPQIANPRTPGLTPASFPQGYDQFGSQENSDGFQPPNTNPPANMFQIPSDAAAPDPGPVFSQRPAQIPENSHRRRVWFRPQVNAYSVPPLNANTPYASNFQPQSAIPVTIPGSTHDRFPQAYDQHEPPENADGPQTPDANATPDVYTFHPQLADSNIPRLKPDGFRQEYDQPGPHAYGPQLPDANTPDVNTFELGSTQDRFPQAYDQSVPQESTYGFQSSNVNAPDVYTFQPAASDIPGVKPDGFLQRYGQENAYGPHLPNADTPDENTFQPQLANQIFGLPPKDLFQYNFEDSWRQDAGNNPEYQQPDFSQNLPPEPDTQAVSPDTGPVGQPITSGNYINKKPRMIILADPKAFPDNHPFRKYPFMFNQFPEDDSEDDSVGLGVDDVPENDYDNSFGLGADKDAESNNGKIDDDVSGNNRQQRPPCRQSSPKNPIFPSDFSQWPKSRRCRYICCLVKQITRPCDRRSAFNTTEHHGLKTTVATCRKYSSCKSRGLRFTPRRGCCSRGSRPK